MIYPRLLSLWQKLWSHRREFAKYFIIGISGFVLDIGSLYILKQHFGLNQVTAVTINQPPLILYVFLLNKKWSFKTSGQTKQQVIRFLALCLMNYCISITWMWIFSHKIGINYQIARISNIALAVSWNFLLYKYWVYNASRAVYKPLNTP